MRLGLFILIALLACAAPAQAAGYAVKNLAASKQIYLPELIEPRMKNSWGVATVPSGFDGHFWITNASDGTAALFIGDAGGAALQQDELLKRVKIARRFKQKDPARPSGIVFNARDDEFIVTQGTITGPSSFIFCTLDGTISGWPEKKNPEGVIERPGTTTLKVDNRGINAVYTGLALSQGLDGNRLYAADFGRKRIDVFDASFKPARRYEDEFRVPDGTLPEGYAPFNVQALDGELYVTYARLGKIAGEEEKGKGKGHILVFDYNGKFRRALQGAGLLNAPWGLAIAPAEFGELGGQLLAGNSGDGRIVAFDLATGKQTGYVKRAEDEAPLEIDGLRGLAFGNGAGLGEANHLYFAAGPAGGADGVFGKITPQ